MNGNAAGLPRVLAIANGKGGVYKTSITAAIGGMAANGGLSTLVVDLDPQGNLTEDLGTEDSTDEGESTFLALRSGTALTPRPTGRDRLDVVYGGTSLGDAEQMLPNRNGGTAAWQHALATSLAPLVDDYDIVVIDCPPRSPVLTTMALVAARYVLIPTKADKSSRKGMLVMASLFTDVRPLNPDLELLGVAITGVEVQATTIRRAAREIVTSTLGDIAPVFDTVIRHAGTPAFYARERGQMLHELNAALETQEQERPWWMLRRRTTSGERSALDGARLPKSTSGVAQDYIALTQEVFAQISRHEQEAAQ